MNKKVMVVDDEPIIAKGISRLLTNTDYSVDVSHTVFSGKKALEICRNETLDIIITDIKMPGINGIELIKEIKKNFDEHTNHYSNRIRYTRLCKGSHGTRRSFLS